MGVGGGRRQGLKYMGGKSLKEGKEPTVSVGKEGSEIRERKKKKNLLPGAITRKADRARSHPNTQELLATRAKDLKKRRRRGGDGIRRVLVTPPQELGTLDQGSLKVFAHRQKEKGKQVLRESGWRNQTSRENKEGGAEPNRTGSLTRSISPTQHRRWKMLRKRLHLPSGKRHEKKKNSTTI